MNHTDQELEAAVLAYWKEHCDWPKKAAFAKQMKVAYNRVCTAILKVQDSNVTTPSTTQASSKISIPADVQSSFQNVWEKASREAASALEAAQDSYNRKVSDLRSERDELAEAFEQSNADLIALAAIRDDLIVRLEETCLQLSETQKKLTAADLRASAYIEATKALGIDLLNGNHSCSRDTLGSPRE